MFMLQSGGLDWLLVKDWSNFRVINGLPVIVDVISPITNDGHLDAREIEVDQSSSTEDTACS